MEKVLLITGAIILGVSLLYAIIAYSSTTKTIFKTVVADGTLPDDVFAYYYLPAAMIKITAVAKVEILTEAATGDFKDATLKELNITAATEVLPDTSQLLLLIYPGNSFVKDDIKITVDESGLLSNVAAIAEDRFSNIISALFKAPSEILKKGETAFVEDAAPVLKAEIKEYTKDFIIPPSGIKAGASNSLLWTIDIPDNADKKKELDASFKVTFSPLIAPGGTTVAAKSAFNGNGIYVRPRIALQTAVFPDNKNSLQKIDISSALITVPDITQAILIPITRAVMVEKKQTLKLKNGMLLENAITKPSEAEALLLIPVNILKSVFSIPAQLLSFRINHMQQQKSLVTEDAALAKAKLDSEKAKLGTDAELAKAKLEAQKTLGSYEQDLLKAKLDTQKAVIDAEKAKITSGTDLEKAKLDNEKAKQGHDAELAKAKLQGEKDLQEAQKNVFTEQTNLLKAWQGLMEEMKKKLPGGS